MGIIPAFAESQIEELELAIETEINKINHHENRLEILQDKLDKNMNRMTTLEAKIHKHENKLDTAQSELARFNQPILSEFALEWQINEIDRLIEVEINKINHHENRLEILQDKLDKNMNRIANLEAKIHKHENKLDKAQSELVRLYHELSEVNPEQKQEDLSCVNFNECTIDEVLIELGSPYLKSIIENNNVIIEANLGFPYDEVMSIQIIDSEGNLVVTTSLTKHDDSYTFKYTESLSQFESGVYTVIASISSSDKYLESKLTIP